MKKLRVTTVVGTRPEIIRLSMLIKKLDQLTHHTLVHTGQNNDPNLNQVFFEDLALRKPDIFLDVDTSSMGAVMADTLRKVELLWMSEKPDAVMILGDTNSAIAAIVAERMAIPVYHMEAGNRSFDRNVPEEMNRRMIDHVASFNLPYNDYSMRNLLAEGIAPRWISKTGSPIGELFKTFRTQIEASSALERLGLRTREYFLVSLHRQENVDFPNRLETIIEMLTDVASRYSYPVLVSTHPRTRKRLLELGIEEIEGLTFHEPFGYLDYSQLQLNSFCVLSDSGTISEESAIMGFSAVTIRDSMERPEALETGSVIMSGLNSANLLRAIERVTGGLTTAMPEGYEVTDFSERVLRFLFSTIATHKTWANLHQSNLSKLA